MIGISLLIGILLISIIILIRWWVIHDLVFLILTIWWLLDEIQYKSDGKELIRITIRILSEFFYFD